MVMLFMLLIRLLNILAMIVSKNYSLHVHKLQLSILYALVLNFFISGVSVIFNPHAIQITVFIPDEVEAESAILHNCASADLFLI